MTWLWVALAGGLGAVLRHLVHAAIAGSGRPSSWATLGVNVLGSFALGLVVGLTSGLAPWVPVVGTGLLGGFTTFSTASAESAELWREGRRGPAAALASGMLLVGAMAAASGWWLGSR
jgi:CrcB protein